MKKKSGKTLMQKWKNKIGGKLSALDKKKLVLTNIPYALAAFYADRAFFLYRNSPGEDMGNKLLYAMEHADRIFAGFVPLLRHLFVLCIVYRLPDLFLLLIQLLDCQEL